jgi:hypothetical protein
MSLFSLFFLFFVVVGAWDAKLACKIHFCFICQYKPGDVKVFVSTLVPLDPYCYNIFLGTERYEPCTSIWEIATYNLILQFTVSINT